MIVREIPHADPVACFAPWRSAPFAALLDSAAEGDPRSRYSYLAVEPARLLTATGDDVRLDGRPVGGDPFTALAAELARWRLEGATGPVPFIGGAVGFLGYELGRHLEELPQRHGNADALPDMVIGFYDAILAFDREARRGWILSSGLPETDPAARERRASARADALAVKLAALPEEPPPFAAAGGAWRFELEPEDYVARVERLLEYIRAGDLYQANFTGRFLAARPAAVAAFSLYRRLRRLSPAPFAAYLACGPELQILSASPERYLRLGADGAIEARPIKGTRPRGATPAEDMALADELRRSVKDRAENLMIADLLRNDIGRVAEIGSVRVPVLCGLETFASVHHLVSVVEGRLRGGLEAVDLLRAAFPGGSVTGAPKIRAMEIIDELEVARRGPYCGSIAWFGIDGAMDSSIVIRTLVATRDRLIAQAGGGIVSDSDPAAEYEELRLKARPLLAVLEGGA
ncbi:MAG: aminodeoxychorismate synthase component I [Dongiaceae bacterium]